MDPTDVPAPVPKLTLPLWAYVAVIYFVVPGGVALLTGIDWRPVIATSLTTLGGTIALRQAVLKPQVVEAALEHRKVNLALGYAAGQASTVKKAAPRKAVAKKAAPRKPRPAP